MRVLHLSSESTWRGGEQQIAYLVKGSIENGIDAIVACRRGSRMEEFCLENNLPHISLRFKSAYDIQTIWKLQSYCRRSGIDIIQTHSSKSHTLAVICGILGLRIPQLLTRRVDFPIKDNWFSRFKYNYKGIRKIICVSNAIRKMIESEIKDQDKLLVVHDGIDLSRFSNPSEWLRKTYSIPKDHLIVGNTSAITAQKDYGTFLKVVERVVSVRKDVHFFIIGDGHDKAFFEQYVLENGLDEFVTFTGFLKNISEVLPSLDIFLFTSQTEGLGTSVLDAMAASLPIVATNAGGVGEIINDNVNGLLYSVKDDEGLADGLMKLMNDQDLCSSLVDKARETVKSFSKEAMTRSTIKVYEEILGVRPVE